LCLLDPGLGEWRRSRAEDGGGGSGLRPGFVVGTEGKVGEVGRSVGTEGNAPSCSSSSSIEGNADANSDSVRVGWRACRDAEGAEVEVDADADADAARSNTRGERGSSGDEPVEDVGDGGPNDAVETNACGEESVEGGIGGDDTV
jgi:hypothetical protein